MARPDFRAEPGRYHLYVSLACPWAHRAIIVRRLLGLESAISMSVVDPIRDERGWAFREGPGHGPIPCAGFEFLSEAYLRTDPSFTGRYTVPCIWDRVTGRLVTNNENVSPQSTPAMPASTPPITNVMTIVRSTSMPMRLGDLPVLGDRAHRPSRPVRATNSCSATMLIDADDDHEQLRSSRS